MKKRFFIALIVFLGISCSKNDPSSLSQGGSTGGGTVNPPPPPPPPPIPIINWPYIYFTMPSAWSEIFVQGDTTSTSFDFRELIFNSNSTRASDIDSFYIQELSGNTLYISHTLVSSGLWYEEALESWLPGPGWEYKWFIRLRWRGRTSNPPFAITPPKGRLVVRFR